MFEKNNVKFYMKDRVVEIKGEDGKVRRNKTIYMDSDFGCTCVADLKKCFSQYSGKRGGAAEWCRSGS